MINVGLVGAGLHSGVHMEGYKLSNHMKVNAVCDVVEGRAREFAAQYGIPHVCADVEEMIDRGLADLVDIVTPPLTHLDLVRRALAADRVHVLCEKPLALDVGEARQMCALADASSKRTFTSFQRRFDPILRHVSTLLRDGFIGDVVLASALVQMNWGLLKKESQAGGYRQWLDSAATGGGFVSGALPHYLDAMRFMLGEVTHLLSHTGTASTFAEGPQAQDGPDDTVVATGTFANGAVFNIAATWSAAHPSGERWEFVGTQRSLQIRPDGRLMVTTPGGVEEVPVPGIPTGEGVINRGFGFGNLGPGFAALADDLAGDLEAGRRSSCATFADGLRNAELIARIFSTSRETARV